MRRRAPGEDVAPYRHKRDEPPLRKLAADLNAWLRANLARLERAEPAMPLEDRAADTWEPLVAVADLAGRDWPDRARRAAVALTADRDAATVASDRIRLLADCRAAFGSLDAIPTTVLLEQLRADPEAPWAEYGSTGLTAMKLAALLREYDIRSTNIRFAAPLGQAKGYYRTDFTDAWNRYAPAAKPRSNAVPKPADEPVSPPEPSQPSQSSPCRSGPGRDLDWDGLSSPTVQAVPRLTCDGTAGTAGTATPRLYLAGGTAAPPTEGAK
jgi:hypothetical protein